MPSISSSLISYFQNDLDPMQEEARWDNNVNAQMIGDNENVWFNTFC